MAFPDDPTGVAVELLLDGEWVDVTGDVYTRDGIAITTGRHDEGARVDAGTCTFTMNNQEGKYSPRNPRSPYYGRLTRNTPVRVSVPGVRGALALDGTPTGYASTPDVAALALTGDLDVRVEVTADWYAQSDTQTLIGQWETTGDQRSWHLAIEAGGVLTLTLSTDGVSTVAPFQFLPYLPPRAAVRVTFHGGSGDGVLQVRFYTAPTLDGPWTQISNDADLTGPGTYPIFNSTAPLRIGPADSTAEPPARPLTGLVHRAEVRNGIDGPIIAAPDFTAPTAGPTFTDTAGRVWTVQGTAAYTTPRAVRFVGAGVAWPSRWETGQDVTVPVQAAGILRRLGQGAAALQSPMRREFANPGRTGMVAYWPMEDGPASTAFASAIPAAPPMRITPPSSPTAVAVVPAAYSGYAASLPLPTMGAGGATGAIPAYTVTGETSLRFVFVAPTTAPASETPVFYTTGTGGVARWMALLTTDMRLKMLAWDVEGTPILNVTTTGQLRLGRPAHVGLELTQTDGDSIDCRLYFIDVDSATLAAPAPVVNALGTLNGATPAGPNATVGRIASVVLASLDVDMGDAAIGHVALANRLDAFTDTFGAMIGWDREEASARIDRLAREQAVPMTVTDYEWETTTPLGPQPTETFLDLIQAAAIADGGILTEDPTAAALTYRARTTLYNQTPALTLDYAAGEAAPPLEPIDDDAATVNDATVSRPGGSSARAVEDTGPMSVDTIGRYATETTLAVAGDNQLPDLASWQLHLGTVDEARYPTIRVDLADDPHLIGPVLDVRAGDRVTITNPPPWLPPEPIDQIVQGWTETIGVRTWAVDYNTTPAAPWTVGVLDGPVTGHDDTDGSHLAAAVDEDDTALQVAVTDGPLWTTDPADGPFDIEAGGEVMTVTGIGGSTSPQTFTVSRGVNGITLPHPAGTDVRLAHPSTLAL